MLRVPKQQIVDLLCPNSTIEEVERMLIKIRTKSAEGNPIRSFPLKEHAFKCDACGHDEAWVYPTHSSCKKCAVVKDKTHRGKEWRDIRERGDLNTCGMNHQTCMSTSYNQSTFMSDRDHKGKAVPGRFTKIIKKHREKMVRKDTKDEHILDAKREFADVCDRVFFGANANEALKLFVKFLTAVDDLRKKQLVLAACMFHTLKKPMGKSWKKVFRNKTKFNDSKRKRLKWVNLKRDKIVKKYRKI